MRLFPWFISSKDDKEDSPPRPQIREVNLQPFEVVLDPPPTFRERVKAFKTHMSNVLRSIDKLTLFVVLFDLAAVGIYQTVNMYSSVYPGSNVARLLNANYNAWLGFYWVLAILAVLGNILILPRAVDYIHHFFILDRISRGHRRVQAFVQLFVFFCIVLPLALGPTWIAFAILPVWRDIAWSHVCDNSKWDMKVTLQGVSWTQYHLDEIFGVVGVAYIEMRSNTNYTMMLFSDPISAGVFHFGVFSTYNTSPPLSTITYNMTLNATSYTVNNISVPFNLVPNLSFPSLDVVLRNPKIPFINPQDSTYPPSADLIFSNSTMTANVLTTQLQNPKTCTELRVCGVEDGTGMFQIALGVVMIQQLQVSLNCTA
jgi:hypothetical protein